MNKITIYHNPRCRKSREALELILKSKSDIEVIEYLKTPPAANDLKGILRKMGMKAEDLLRKKEPLFEKKFKGKKLSEKEWIEAMVKNPILIERPVVVKGNTAVIGRPPENVLKLLK